MLKIFVAAICLASSAAFAQDDPKAPVWDASKEAAILAASNAERARLAATSKPEMPVKRNPAMATPLPLPVAGFSGKMGFQ